MSNRRTMLDFPRNEVGLVDEFIGTAYDVVKEVHDNLDAIRNVGDQLEQLDDLAKAAVEEAMVPARVEIQGKIDEAAAEANRAEAAADRANSINTQYPFNFVEGQAQYSVTGISGDPNVNTSGMALWVEGALEYDFTINSPTLFTLNTPSAYADGAQMKIIINGHFDDVISNLTALQQSFTDEFNQDQIDRKEEFQEFLDNSGLEIPIAYGPGITLTRNTQVLNYAGVNYRPDARFLPFTTTTWAADSGKFVLAPDVGLRQDLYDDSPLKGMALLKYTANFMGAVSRGAPEKLRENVSILDFKDIDPTGNNLGDSAWQTCFNEVVGHNLLIPKGLYSKSARTQIHGNTRVILEPGATIRRVGSADGWMFVNGEVGNPSWANGYDGDGNIHFEGGVLDLNGFSGRSAAAFVMGHHKRCSFQRLHMINGWESHYIEMNSGVDALIDYCLFEKQGFEGTGSYECVNIDSANAAGFPAYGEYDLTTNTNVVVQRSVFRDVFGGVSSHGIAAGAGQHRGVRVLDNWFERTKSKAVRAQGWDDSIISRNTFIDIGEEAVSLLLSNRCDVSGNKIYGTSQRTSGSYSAIRIQGDDNVCKQNRMVFTGFANQSPYSYGIAAGSNRNKIDLAGAVRGSSGIISDNGTLTEIDGRTLLYSGTGGTVPGTILTMADSISNFDSLELMAGIVANGNHQSGIARPYARRAWLPGTDYVGIATAQGRFVAQVTSQTTLQVTRNDDSLRQIFGVNRI